MFSFTRTRALSKHDLPGCRKRGGEEAGERERGEDQEAAFPATESTRTSRDLAPDASFAAQAGGFFYALRPLAGNGTSRLAAHEYPVRLVATMRS